MSLTLRILSVTDNKLIHKTGQNAGVDLSGCGHTLNFAYYDLSGTTDISGLAKTTFTNTEIGSLKNQNIRIDITSVALDGTSSFVDWIIPAHDGSNVTLTYQHKNMTPGSTVIYGARFDDTDQDPHYLRDGNKETIFTVKTIPDLSKLTTVKEITDASSVRFTHNFSDAAARGYSDISYVSYQWWRDDNVLDKFGPFKDSSSVTFNSKTISDLSSVAHTFLVKFGNAVGYSERLEKATPSVVPGILSASDLKLVSNLENATSESRSNVDGGVTVFFKLPSNHASLAAIGAPLTRTSVKLQFFKLEKGVWVADAFTKEREITDLCNNSLRTSDPSFNFQVSFDVADVPLGRSVKAQVAFKNKNGPTDYVYSALTDLAMSMKLAENPSISYHIIDASSSCAIDLYRNVEPDLFSASAPTNNYRIYTKTNNGTESAGVDISFEEIFEDASGVFIGRDLSSGKFIELDRDGKRTMTITTNGVRTASSVRSISSDGTPSLLDGVVRLYKYRLPTADVTPGNAYTIRVCTLSKAPFSNSNIIFESTGVPSRTLHAKRNVGQLAASAITCSPVDANGIPLKLGTDPAVNIRFTVPTNDLSLNGGAKGAVSFVVTDSVGVPIPGANALSYPVPNADNVTASALSWTVAQPLGPARSYRVAVQVMDEQKTTKSNTLLPTVSTSSTLGTHQTSADIRSIDYVPAVTNLKLTRLADASMNISWTKQEPQPGQGYLYDGSFVNVLVVLDDVSGSTVSAVDVSFSDLSRNVAGLIRGRKYSAHVIPRQTFGSSNKIMKNKESISFVAGTNPSVPQNLASYPTERKIVLDWENSTANGGTLDDYEIAAIRDVSASTRDYPQFPTEQKYAAKTSVSYFTLQQAYPAPDGKNLVDISNNEKYKVAVRSTSKFSSAASSLSVTYESLTLVGSVVTETTLFSAWSNVVDVIPALKPDPIGEVTVLSDASNVTVSWAAQVNQEFLVFNNNDLYFKSSQFAALDGTPGVDRLQDGLASDNKYSYSQGTVGGRHNIKCGLSTKDLNIFNVTIGGVLSDVRSVDNVSAMVAPGVVTDSLFEVVDASTCRVSFKAPSDAGAAGQSIFTADGKRTNGSLLYEITVETPENTIQKTFKDINTLSRTLDGITGSSIFIAIKAYYMQGQTAVAGAKVYVNRMNGNTREGIRLGPSPRAGTIGNVKATDASANQISFEYRFPAEVPNYAYPINKLEVKVFDGLRETASFDLSSGSFAYDSSRNIVVQNLKYGKRYRVQVQPIGNYFNAQNPPSSEIAEVVPYAKMEIVNIAKSGDKYTCDVSLNGDVINHITAISKPTDSGSALVIIDPINSMVKKGVETTTHAAEQTATFEFTSANSKAALVIVSGKTSDIRDHPANSFGANIPL